MEKSGRKRIALTGGIACGKSQVARFLNEAGIETIDADDIVHELVPEEERRRLAKTVFNDPAARKALEAKLHPIVKARIDDFLRAGGEGRRLAVIPLLFEVGWDADFDFIAAVVPPRETQISRMCSSRGYSREEAEARIASQMPTDEKAARADFVITNDSTLEELKNKTAVLAERIEKII